MNREIKFRAWDKLNGQMVLDLANNWIDFYGNYWTEPQDTHDTPHQEIINPVNQPIIMQFTGITDRHGKEIYEGDVISKNGKGSHQVYYDAAMFLVKYETDSWSLSHIRNEDLEVIGDIYQNPELLK